MKQPTKNFGFLPKEYSTLDKAKVVLLPIPYDGTSSWLKGADKGPNAIIESSINFEWYDIETNFEVYKEGIHTAAPVKVPAKPEAMTQKSEQAVKNYLDKDKMVVVLGGEHSVSVGAIKAYQEKYKNLSVLQLDAHADLRNSYQGSKYNHACVMARVKEICPIVQVGIRSMDISEKDNLAEDRIFYAHEIYNQNDWQDKAIQKLSDQVYITIDLDVFDLSILPATGTPEPGGLEWYPVINFLKKVCAEKNVVGFDVVELCPNKFDKTSDYLAAKLIYKLLSYIFIAK
ncbi:MAG: agmatinase [Patescibacteria group bacterium]|nr:agmatinase [Patescibacteria group bacterium]MDD4611031.1 agmatinase [Patescibacteria group bacterium]